MGYRNIELTQLSFLIILAYAFVLAIQNFFSKTYIKNIDAIYLARGRVFFTLLFFGSFSFLTGRIQYPISIEVMLYALIGAFFGAFLGWMAFFKALSYIEVSKSISIRSIESFFTAISAFLILGLVPTVNQLVGGALIIIGIIALGQTKLGAKQWKHKKS
jgi:drug/metabolite transporter (DMT)-like permease